MGLRLQEVWLDHGGYRDRVVQRRGVEVEGVSVGGGEVLHELGDDGAHAAKLAQPPPSLGAGASPVGYVEAAHDYGEARSEDLARGLGVDVDVELRGRRRVAQADAAAHEGDQRDAVFEVRALAQKHRDVRQGSEGDKGHGPWRGLHGVGHERRRLAGIGCEAGLRDLGPVQPALAVDGLGGLKVAFERCGGAGRHGHVLAPYEGQDAQRVAGGLLERDVAGHRGHGDHVQLRGAAGHHHRHGVVVAGVDVQDHGGRDAFSLHGRRLTVFRTRVQTHRGDLEQTAQRSPDPGDGAGRHLHRTVRSQRIRRPGRDDPPPFAHSRFPVGASSLYLG